MSANNVCFPDLSYLLLTLLLLAEMLGSVTLPHTVHYECWTVAWVLTSMNSYRMRRFW